MTATMSSATRRHPVPAPRRDTGWRFGSGGLDAAVVPAVSKVEDEPDDQPPDQPGPVRPAEAVDHGAADHDAEDRDDRQRRHRESTLQIGPFVAHDPDAQADEDEREQRADARHLADD